MQSTGQTSTHALSLTLMHGSAIMYGIQASRCVRIRWVWSDQRFLYPNHRRLSSFPRSSAPPRRLASLGAKARVEGVAQGVAEEVEGEDGEADREPWKDRHPGRPLSELDGRA